MKKISLALVLITVTFITLSYVKTFSYVPFKLKTSRILTMEEQKLVTLKEHRIRLKLSGLPISTIESISDLKNDEVILLPWFTIHEKLQYLPMNNFAFFESKQGVIQVKTISKKNDGYKHFLENNVKLTAGGTVVLARGVHKVIQRHNDIQYPWLGTQHLFEKSDINILNFKSPLIEKFVYPKSSWVLVGKKEYAKAMANAKIDLVSIAGNHMGDATPSGLLETIRTLKDLNIETIGAGKTKTTAYACKKIKKNNTSFGFLGFNNVPGSIGRPNSKSPGIAWLDKDAINAIKSCDEKVDQLIVMVNWGIEYTHVPRKKEQQWAKRMIDAGADLILGDQAHWVQTHEVFNGKHISYGLGNYIFDQHWSQNTTEGIIQSFIFYNNKIFAIDTIPIKLKPDGSITEIKKNTERYFYVLDAYNGLHAAIEK